MQTTAVNVRHLVLGLLTEGPQSGYDIRRSLKALGWLIGTSSFGSIYPSLHGLLTDGLASMEVVAATHKPPRKVYAITEEGRRQVQEWVRRPTALSDSLRAFVMRLILAGNLTQDGLAYLLQSRRRQVLAQQASLGELEGTTMGQADLGRQWVLSYVRAMGVAELAWLGEALSRLDRRSID